MSDDLRSNLVLSLTKAFEQQSGKREDEDRTRKTYGKQGENVDIQN
jgi:hypothetical protein